ncbi:MAG: hypothetical protein JKY11_07520 [Alphaproteobacteria bacterium]|nr:hypothetical protein [Alphaproteobacteria bacterium]
MNHIAYFKLLAKNLFKDYKTQAPYIEDGETYYGYDPEYLDIDRILLEYLLADMVAHTFPRQKPRHHGR